MNKTISDVYATERAAVEKQTREIVAQVLALPEALSECWDILSVYPETQKGAQPVLPRLALVHYNDKYDPDNRSHAPLRMVRGPVVDLQTKIVYAESYGHTGRMPCYTELKVDADANTVEFETELKLYLSSPADKPDETPKVTVGARVFSLNEVSFYVGNEVVVIRVFKFGGRIFYATHKTLYGELSKFGDAEFMDIYRRLLGPEARDKNGQLIAGSQRLFEEVLPYSPYCYIFLVADNTLRLASSTMDNRVIHVATKEMWGPQALAREYGDPYFCLSDSDFTDPVKIQHIPNKYFNPYDRGVTIQNKITVHQANQILFPDKFATPIEADPVIPDMGSTTPFHMYKNVKIHKPRSNERSIKYVYDEKQEQLLDVQYVPLATKPTDDRLLGGDFVVMYYRHPSGNTYLYHLESWAYNHRVNMTDNNPNFYHRFVVNSSVFVHSTFEELSKTYPVYPEIDTSTSLGRVEWWARIMEDSGRPSYRCELANMYGRYLVDLNKIAHFILHNTTFTDQEEIRRLNEKTIKRFNDVRTIALHGKGGQHPIEILKSLLRNEHGQSLYKMFTTVAKIQELREKKKAKEEAAKIQETTETK